LHGAEERSGKRVLMMNRLLYHYFNGTAKDKGGRNLKLLKLPYKVINSNVNVTKNLLGGGLLHILLGSPGISQTNLHYSSEK
jgi:hypothetical protein